MRPISALLLIAMLAACAPERPSDITRDRRETTDTSAARAESARKEIVADVAGEPISREQLERRIAALSPALRSRYASTQQRQELLPTLTIFEVLVDEGERRELGGSAQVREALREELAIQHVEAQLRATVQLDAIDDAALRAYYDAHPELWQRAEQRDVAAIEAPDAAQLDALLARWQAAPAADTAARILELRKLAARYSTDRVVADKGGDLGWIEPPPPIDGLPTPQQRWQQAVFALGKPGDATPPVELEPGTWRAGVLMAVQPARAIPFDELKGALRDRLYAERREAARADLVRRALAAHKPALTPAGVAASPAPQPPIQPPPEPLAWLLTAP
jgi:hypothetical protein